VWCIELTVNPCLTCRLSLSRFSSVQDLIKEKEFKTFVQLKPFEQFEEALKAARQGYKDGKVVLTY